MNDLRTQKIDEISQALLELNQLATSRQEEIIDAMLIMTNILREEVIDDQL